MKLNNRQIDKPTIIMLIVVVVVFIIEILKDI